MIKIAFFSNYLNHHQAPLADELYRLTGGDYRFIATIPVPEFRKKIGYMDYSDRPYLVQTFKNSEAENEAMKIALEADVAMFCGRQVLKYQVARAKKGLMSFEVSERWFKNRVRNYFSPALWKNQFFYHTLFYNTPLYKLCTGAYAANDQYTLHSFKDKCFKWGYFTSVDNDFDVDELRKNTTKTQRTSIMWCARFLRLKHPELPIKLAAELKRDGFQFYIDMFGNGKELKKTESLAKKLGVDDVVCFKGNVPNRVVLEEMRKHEIFLFTSNRNEGWGAVNNEAMSSGCTLVGTDAVGSIPYLIKHRENGCIFKSNDLESLKKEVVWLLENPEERYRLAKNGVETLRTFWSPQNAAKSLMTLISDLKAGRETTVNEGPCSRAYPFKKGI